MVLCHFWWTKEYPTVIRECLSLFCSESGQKVNTAKSSLLVSKQVPLPRAKYLSEILEIPLEAKWGNYLGVPSIQSRVVRRTYCNVLEKVQHRLQGWKSKCLSLAARVTLIKSVTSAIPSYTMQTALLPKSILRQLDQWQRAFLWGSNPETRKMYKVRWETVCRPKQEGGLGIRKMENQNKALLAKQTWRVISRDDSLPVKLLLHKYSRKSTGLSICNYTPRDSATWKGICKQVPIVEKGLRKVVFDGKSTFFWLDNWLGHSRLCEWLTSEIPGNLLFKKVADFWDMTRWKWEDFGSFLPNHILLQIASKRVFSIDKPDSFSWLGDPTGSFSVSTAYWLQEGNIGAAILQAPVDSVWKSLWKLHITERQRLFGWLLLHNSILTKAELARRGLNVAVLCPLCNLSVETPIHLFRDCTLISTFWKLIIPQNDQAEFFQHHWHPWLVSNIKNIDYKWNGLAWGSAFVVICWWIWKVRNEMVFAQRRPNLEITTVQRHVQEIAHAYEREKSSSSDFSELFIGWTPPLSGWCMLNTDGASKGGRNAACGGLIRDEYGSWIIGFCSNLGYASSLEAELLGVLQGLTLAWEKGLQRVLVSIDSKVVLLLLQKSIQATHPVAPLVQSCKDFLVRNWVIRFQHVYREGNRAADKLANLGLEKPLGTHVLSTPPRVLQSILLEDVMGISLPRKVRQVCNLHSC